MKWREIRVVWERRDSRVVRERRDSELSSLGKGERERVEKLGKEETVS